MRYLLIDRIQRLECNKEVVAIKSVALSEDVYADHFFGSPVMPGALLIESLAQAGTALLEVSANYGKKALLVMVDRAKFRRLVRPGDQLLVTATMRSLESDHARIEGKIHVSDRLVMDAELTFVLKHSEDFYSPRVKFLVEALYDVWLKDAQLLGLDQKREVEEKRDV
jgi:3-hydroxyacyl-[acyl-carrier-protein] dehydratase